MDLLPKPRKRFPKPVVESGADPYVVVYNDHFYYCHVIEDKAIYIRKAKTLDQIGKVEPVKVWPSSNKKYDTNMWAPELHHIDGKWYIYFANGPTVQHFSGQKMYVLEGIGDDPQTAKYSFKGNITDSSNQWGIDGTILTMPDDKRYYIWSGWDNPENRYQNLYIAQMANPWTLIGKRVRIASPIYPWETIGGGINEGPEVLPQGDTRHIIYSASHSLTDHYCLGQLTLIGDNPLEPTHWIKHPTPIFESHKGIIAPGHASFLLTADQRNGWMIFHSARHAGAGWDRQVRLAAFKLRDDGKLKFVSTKLSLDKWAKAVSPVRLLQNIVRRKK